MCRTKTDEFVSKNSMLRKLESCQPDQFFNITQIRNFIKAEPEKKGKLLNANPVGECSVCGWLIDYRDGFNYCPGCGARLEENNGRLDLQTGGDQMGKNRV